MLLSKVRFKMLFRVLMCIVLLFTTPVFSQSITTENLPYFETVVNHSDNKLQSAGVLIGGIAILGLSTVGVISGFTAIVYGGNFLQKGGLESLISGPLGVLFGFFLIGGGVQGMALGASLSAPAIHALTLSDEEKYRINTDIQVLKNKNRKNEKTIMINNQEQILHDLR